MSNYYEILGISKNATVVQIKKAYREKAKKLHPDHNKGDPVAEKKFKELNEAHSILSDPKKRNIYDKFGKDAANKINPTFQGFGGYEDSDEENGIPIKSNNFYNAMNGQGFPFNMNNAFMDSDDSDESEEFDSDDEMPEEFTRVFGKTRKKQKNKSSPMNELLEPIKVEFVPTYAQILKGGKFKVKVERVKSLSNLAGCNTCKGKGRISTITRLPNMVSQSITDCPSCRGKGSSINDMNKEIIDVEFKMPRGVIDGHAINIPNKGHLIPPELITSKNTRSDVIVILKDPPERGDYERGFNGDQSNIVVTMTITVAESICGFKRKLKDFDGKVFSIICNKCVKEGSLLIIEDRGLAKFNHLTARGHLIVKTRIDPGDKKLTEIEKKTIWEILEKTKFKLPTVAEKKKASKMIDLVEYITQGINEKK